MSGHSDVITFARRLARFEERVQETVWHLEAYGPGQHGQAEHLALAESYLMLIRGLAADREVLDVLAEAIELYDDREREYTRAERSARRNAEAQARERRKILEAEELVTRTAECPHCGQPPGLVCRSTGPQRQARVESHRSRYRAARHILDSDGAGDDSRDCGSLLSALPDEGPR